MVDRSVLDEMIRQEKAATLRERDREAKRRSRAAKMQGDREFAEQINEDWRAWRGLSD